MAVRSVKRRTLRIQCIERYGRQERRGLFRTGRPNNRLGRQLEQLLKRLATPEQKLHAARVTEVLEQIGTPEARKVLEALAKEATEGLLTREAKASLGRIDKAQTRSGSERDLNKR